MNNFQHSSEAFSWISISRNSKPIIVEEKHVEKVVQDLAAVYLFLLIYYNLNTI